MPTPIARPPPTPARSPRRLARPRRVEVADDDVRALGGEAGRDGPADAAGPAGDERDAPRQLLLGRRLGELVELERPVLDVEGVLRGQRHVVAERGGRAEHRDGVVVDVVDDAGGAAILAGSEHAEPGHHDHARKRIGQRRALAVMGLEVRGVVGDEAFHRASQGRGTPRDRPASHRREAGQRASCRSCDPGVAGPIRQRAAASARRRTRARRARRRRPPPRGDPCRRAHAACGATARATRRRSSGEAAATADAAEARAAPGRGARSPPRRG